MRVVAVMLLLIGGCSGAPHTTTSSEQTAPPANTSALTGIAVYPPFDGWVTGQDLSLEVGDQAWSLTDGGSGVISPILSEISAVRLFGVGDCHVHAAFEAAPGRDYIVRLAEDGSASVEESTIGLEDGPGMGEREDGLTGCE